MQVSNTPGRARIIIVRDQGIASRDRSGKAGRIGKASAACPSKRRGGVPDNRVGHGPSSDTVRATRQCHPEGSPALTASYGICLADLAWAMDGSANLSCLQAQRSDKVMFSGGFIRARPVKHTCYTYPHDVAATAPSGPGDTACCPGCGCGADPGRRVAGPGTPGDRARARGRHGS